MLHHEHSRVINLYHDSVTLQSGGMLIILSPRGIFLALKTDFMIIIRITQVLFCGNL